VAPDEETCRFWARTGCNFTASNNNAACLTGDCEGQLACKGSIGSPPATLLEVSLNKDPSKGSSYDVSLVDGYNLPVAVSVAGKGSAGSKDVNAACPPELQVTAAGGTVVACKSACLAFGHDAFCCRASVYSRLFKDACPAYYSYAYDTTAATGSGCYAPEYMITFCPDRWGQDTDVVRHRCNVKTYLNRQTACTVVSMYMYLFVCIC
jgi:hypothetical protein